MVSLCLVFLFIIITVCITTYITTHTVIPIITPVTHVMLSVYDNVYLLGHTVPSDWSMYATDLVHGMVRSEHDYMCVDTYMWDITADNLGVLPGVAMSWRDEDDTPTWSQYSEEEQARLYQQLDDQLDAHEDAYIEAITPTPRYTQQYIASHREYVRHGMPHTPNSKKQGAWLLTHRNKHTRAHIINNKRYTE